MGPNLPHPVRFVRHDAAGCITGDGAMERRYIDVEAAERGGILAGDGTAETHYVDLAGAAPRLRPRRRLVVAFDTLMPAPGAPARVQLPEGATISLAGPVTETVRAGGAVALVLRVPGVYTLTFEAWPLRPAVETLTVPLVTGPLPEPPAGAIVVGPGLEAVRARAKALLTRHYDALALSARPAGLQPADLLKAAEAERVRSGGASDWIAAEAAARGVLPAELAEAIAVESAKTIARDLERVRVTQAAIGAESEPDIVAVLAAAGVAFTMPREP